LRHAAYDVVGRPHNERPCDDCGQQHIEAAHSFADTIEARLEDERIEENPPSAAPDIEPALISRKRPTFTGCVAPRCHPIHHHEARTAVQFVTLCLREMRICETDDRIRHDREQRIRVDSRCQTLPRRPQRSIHFRRSLCGEQRARTGGDIRSYADVVTTDKPAAERRGVHPAR
jgi:hypothetical protein